MPDRDGQPQLVVVGSSAGGIDALSTLVSTLPPDFGAPVVIAQHLDPRRPSHLTAILGNRSTLPVMLVTDHALLTDGTIFLVPSNHHVEISDHQVSVTEAGAAAPRPSVNRLFESAAEAYGEGLIAVILSGTGSDGTAGARHVKAMGGTVVIQNPDTASFPEMPLSLSPTTVDVVADLDAIGPLLNDLVKGAHESARPEEDRLLRAFLSDMRERTGIDFASYKRPTIMRRLQRRMIATGTSRLRDYVRHVHSHEEEFQRLTSSFLIKVTEFFRDPDLYDYLRSDVIPGLIETARKRENELRIWSAGCATGEEAYSVAITLCEALGDSVAEFNIRVFATDLDNDSVNFARRGVYPAAALAKTPDHIVEKYFNETASGDFEIKKRVRALTVFGQHDLGQRAPFPRIDLALCRNVLIYFTPELQKRALHLFAFSLRDDGYLVLGKAETTNPLPEHFVLENSRLKVYRRHGEPVLIPSARIRDSAPAAFIRREPRRLGTGGASRWRREAPASATASERAETVLMHLPVGVITLNQDYDIAWLNSAARRLLGIHTAAIGADFVHLSSTLPANDLRHMIDTAFAGESCERTFEFKAPDDVSDGTRVVSVVCQPQVADTSNSTPELVSILVTDLSDTTRTLAAERLRANESDARSERLMARLRDLDTAYKELLRANEELTSGGAVLRTGNEELLLANEEVQAASEEVETLNEELQATNEELETLNEEMQATNEELNTANDDLESRALELTTLATSLEQKKADSDAVRARLEAVLQSMPAPILVVDEEGRRMLANKTFESAFPADAVIEDQGGKPLAGKNSIEARALLDESGSEIVVRARGAGRESEWYTARTLQVFVDGKCVGGVVSFTRRPKPPARQVKSAG